LRLETTRHLKDCINVIDATKSAEFGKFPCHLITLPNVRELFWWQKKSVTEKVFSLYIIKVEISGRAARLASCLFIVNVGTRVTDSSVLIQPLVREKQKCQVAVFN
jgi:hypothetical protein